MSTNELISYCMTLMKLLCDGSPFWNECYAHECGGLKSCWSEAPGAMKAIYERDNEHGYKYEA